MGLQLKVGWMGRYLAEGLHEIVVGHCRSLTEVLNHSLAGVLVQLVLLGLQIVQNF